MVSEYIIAMQVYLRVSFPDPSFFSNSLMQATRGQCMTKLLNCSNLLILCLVLPRWNSQYLSFFNTYNNNTKFTSSEFIHWDYNNCYNNYRFIHEYKLKNTQVFRTFQQSYTQGSFRYDFDISNKS